MLTDVAHARLAESNPVPKARYPCRSHHPGDTGLSDRNHDIPRSCYIEIWTQFETTDRLEVKVQGYNQDDPMESF
jgi:hypothetical protein